MRRTLLSAGTVLISVMIAATALAGAGKVALVIEVESIDKLTGDLDAISDTFGLSSQKTAIEKSLEANLHTTGLRGIDAGKTAQIFVFLPAAAEGAPSPGFAAASMVWIVPLSGDGSSYINAVRAMFENSMKVKGVYQFSERRIPGPYPLPDFFVGRAKNLAIAGNNKDNVEFLTGLLQKSSIQAAGMKNVRGTVRAAVDIKTCLPAVEAVVSQAGPFMGRTPFRPGPNPAQNPVEKLQTQAKALMGILAQISSFTFGIGIDSGSVELSTSMIPQSNSNLDGIIKAMGAPSEEYMKLLPENSYLSAAGSDLSIMDEFIDPYCDMLKALYAEMGPQMNEVGTQTISSMRAMKGMYSGDYAIGVVPGPDGSGVNIVEALAVTDPAKARKQAEEALATYSETYAAMTPGMSVTVKDPRTYKGIEILCMEYSMGEQVKGVPGMPALIADFKAEMAFTDKAVLYTTGKPEVMNTAIDRLKAKSETPIDRTAAFREVFPKVRGNPVKVANLRPLGLLKAAITGMPGVNAQQLQMIPDDSSSISSYSYKEGSEVIGVVRLSLEELAAVRKSVPMALGVLTQAVVMGAMQQPGQAEPGSTKTLCIRNLRILDAAKEQCALERNLNDGDAIQPEWLNKYLFGEKMPTCSEGGNYTIGAVGEPPTCSVPGHSLD